MPELKRIGVLDLSLDSWTAGVSYTRMMVNSLAGAVSADPSVELCLLTKKKSAATQRSWPASVVCLEKPRYSSLERLLGKVRPLPEKSELYETAVRKGISVVLPIMEIPGEIRVPTIGWIPDFQHVHWPQFFTESTLKGRDRRFRTISEQASLVMLSSESARNDFARFAPEWISKARVVSFPSLFAFDPPPEANEVRAVERFHLPEKFALVANQFWKHKNHIAVIKALGELKRKGLRIPVVFTGQMSDYRDPQNAIVSTLMQAIAEEDLLGEVIVLGRVDYRDLIELMRTAAVAIQPSMAEGWSTSVQDSKALGRPLICSDLEVHREQAPGALGFFACDQPSQLAAILEEHWSSLVPGPDPVAEAAALEKERAFAREHGQKLLAMCREACGAVLG